MIITVNGAPRELAVGHTVSELLAELGVRADLVAVEHNGEVLERARFGEVVLRTNDRLEVVRFVGGG